MAYRSYRGNHSGLRRFLTAFIIVMLFVITVLVYILLEPNIIVFTKDGVQFNAGWFSSETPSASPSAQTAAPSLQVVAPSAASSSPTSAQTTRPEIIKALFVPTKDLADNSAVEDYIKIVSDTDINALVLDMKPDSGLLSFPNSISDAKTSGATAPYAQSVSGAIKRFQEKGIYLIARMSCFKDNTAPRKIQSASIKVKSGVIWLDRNNETWLNPYSDRAAAYLTDVAKAIEALGFDEILLDNYNFPVSGKLSYINYGSTDKNGEGRPAALEAVSGSISKALNGKTLISAVVLQDALKNGSDTVSGQKITIFNGFDKVYAYIPQDITKVSFNTIYDSAQKSLKDKFPGGFVPIVTTPADISAQGADEALKSAIDVSGGSKGLGFVAYSETGEYPQEGY